MASSRKSAAPCSSSELDSPYELHVSRPCDASAPRAEVTVSQRGVEGLATSITGTREVVQVEGIECLCADDKHRTLGDPGPLAKRDIDVAEGEPPVVGNARPGSPIVDAAEATRWLERARLKQRLVIAGIETALVDRKRILSGQDCWNASRSELARHAARR